jgi:penicillin-binding protein 1C
MAVGKGTRNTNVSPANKAPLTIARFFGGLFLFVGKPFYYLLFGVIATILFFISLFTKTLKKILRFLTKFRFSSPKIHLGINKKIAICFLVVSATILSVWFFIFRALPSPRELTTRQQEVSTKIYDRNGVLLYKIYKNQNRTPIGLDTIPEQVRLATLAAEDAEFYSHLGFSVRGILRAIVKNIKKGELAGGSTITQQLVKNALLSPEKTLIRKIKELVLAVEVEALYSKDEILEMYLNEVSYGGTAYGIQEASRVYFGKDVGKLSLSEASLLAGLPKAPSRFSPFGSQPELSRERQKEVLNLMVINKYISSDQAMAAAGEVLKFASNKTEIKAPHFVMYIRSLLAEKYGEEMVEKGGLEVTTTLDYSIQKMAEEAVANEIGALAGYRVGNGAALVISPESGEILAMVGSKDYFNRQADGNVNIVTSLRQPGSSIKVINYAYALGHGYTAATIVDDSPVTFSVPGQKPYTPKNYDGKYRGQISLRSALAESRNIPAVKVLASYGVTKMIELGQSMGITTWTDPSRYGLSLTLGGGEIKLIDLAEVYATIANYGVNQKMNSILKITDYRGRLLEENSCTVTEEAGEISKVYAAEAKVECNGKEVLDPRVAYILIDILKDNLARTPAFGARSSLVIPDHPEVAVKTGTSNDLKDNLTLGFTSRYLVATWVGNNDATPMSHVASGITGAAPIFNRIMSGLLDKEPSIDWVAPAGIQKMAICSYTATLPCQGCPTKLEWFLDENKPTKVCLPQTIKTIEETKKSNSNGRIVEPAASEVN